MKKLLLLLILLNFGNASEFIKNDKLFLIEDKPYIIRCIENYKWIQFIEPLHGRGGTIYNPVGNPQQMFIREGAKMLPIEC